jgi:hypothetical protein
MAIKIDIRGLTEVKNLLRDMKKEAPGILRFATNDTLEFVRDAESAAMKRVFDRPTPFILNSLRIDYLKAEKMEGRVLFKDAFASPKYDPVRDTLTPHIEGKSRRPKYGEYRLRKYGIIAHDEFLVPSRTAPVNQYGNIPGPTMVKILSSLQAFKEGGYKANTSTKINYIIGNVKGTKGIYQIQGGVGNAATGRWKLIFLIVKKQMKYNKRFEFYEIAQKEFDRVFPKMLDAKIARALGGYGFKA